MMMSGGKKALMNPCWEKLFIFTGKGYAHQRISPVNGIQIIEYFSAGCFVLNPAFPTVPFWNILSVKMIFLFSAKHLPGNPFIPS